MLYPKNFNEMKFSEENGTILRKSLIAKQDIFIKVTQLLPKYCKHVVLYRLKIFSE